MSFRRMIGRRLHRLLQHRKNTGDFFYGDLHFISAGETLSERYNDIAQISDFRPTDKVIDVGCAEGLISLEVAQQVASVRGIDIDANRIERACLEAKRRSVANVTFEVASVADCWLDTYDVTLFLSVYGKQNTARIGMNELRRLLRATRRQIIVRANVQGSGPAAELLSAILTTMDEEDFDGFCFPAPAKGATNLIVGNRHGTDAASTARRRLFCCRRKGTAAILYSAGWCRFPHRSNSPRYVR